MAMFAPTLARPVLALGILGLLAACRGGSAGREKGLSVLLVTIDTLRSDRLGAYGDSSAETPLLDRLAASGVLFRQAHAHDVVTLVSHANILSGLYPFSHGVRDNDGYRFPRSRETLATLLKGAGYRTGAFVSGFPLDARFGLGRGFDVYDDHLGSPEEAARGFHLEERRGEDTVSRALDWLGSGPPPSFCWVHLYEPHAPYRPPEPFATRFSSDPYRGEVAAADFALRRLLEPILDAGEKGRTLVVVTADHGESLGEHGERTHGLLAYEATLRVPLIVFAPRLFTRREVPALVRHVDLLPTILDVLGLETPAGLPGRSLRPLLLGKEMEAAPSYFEALSANFSRGWAPIKGVIQESRKFIELPVPELYDLDADPKEARNLASSRGGEVSKALALLRSYEEQDQQSTRIPESEETRSRLRSLGYLSGQAPSPKVAYGAQDDPKNRIGVENEFDRVLELEEGGQAEAAFSLCEQVVREMPRATAPLVQLALLARGRGDLEGGIAALRKALALNPRAPQVLFRLGQFLLEAGRAGDAVSLLEPHASDDGADLDATMTLGAALAQTGKRAEALRVLEEVLAKDPSNALCLVNIGTVHLMAKDYPAARRAVQAALALQPNLALGHNTLGVIDAEQGEAAAAIEDWRRAVAIDPKAYDTLFNLGMLLIRESRPDEARGYLERFARGAPPAQYRADIGRVRAWIAAQGAHAQGT